MQQGRYVGDVIEKRETGRSAPPPFRYFDKGNMAVIGRGFAILDSRVVKNERTPGTVGMGLYSHSVSPSAR